MEYFCSQISTLRFFANSYATVTANGECIKYCQRIRDLRRMTSEQCVVNLTVHVFLAILEILNFKHFLESSRRATSGHPQFNFQPKGPEPIIKGLLFEINRPHGFLGIKSADLLIACKNPFL